MAVNFTYIMENFMQWSTQGYTTALGVIFWPLFFCGIIGYVYMKQQSLVAVTIVILIIFSVFGNALLGVTVFTILMYLIVSLVMTALFLIFMTKVRK